LPVIYLCCLLSSGIAKKPTKNAKETFAEVGKQLGEIDADAASRAHR
jgi:hypothetical protein